MKKKLIKLAEYLKEKKFYKELDYINYIVKNSADKDYDFVTDEQMEKIHNDLRGVYHVTDEQMKKIYDELGDISEKIESDDTKRIFDSLEPFEEFRNVEQENSPYARKPEGLWYSCGNEWREFVEREQFGAVYKHSYEIRPDFSKILQIKSAEELDAFHKEYGSKGKFGSDIINWESVQSDGYAGIEICPYIYERRFKYNWYNPWDVASGCIWDESGIINIQEISQE